MMETTQPTCLPQELVEEILLLLPVQSVWKFRSACKAWRDLVVNDHVFAKLHLTNRAVAGADNHQSIVYTAQYSTSLYHIKPPLEPELIQPSQTELVLDDPPLPVGSSLVGSCNGLLCFSCYDDRQIILMYPSTRRLKFSPEEEFESVGAKGNINVFGFGYDSTVDDYKAVRHENSISGYGPNGPIFKCSVKVYSMNTNSWRKVVIHGLRFNFPVVSEPGIFLNGVIHWKIRSPRDRFISFDVKEEEFGRVRLPPPSDESKDIVPRVMMIVRERLGIVRIHFLSAVYEVWLMMEYGKRESWTKQFVVRLYPQMSLLLSHFTIIGNQIVFSYDDINKEKRIICDTKTKKIVDIDMRDIGPPLELRFTTYIESLVSLKSKGLPS